MVFSNTSDYRIVGLPVLRLPSVNWRYTSTKQVLAKYRKHDVYHSMHNYTILQFLVSKSMPVFAVKHLVLQSSRCCSIIAATKARISSKDVKRHRAAGRLATMTEISTGRNYPIVKSLFDIDHEHDST